MSMELRNYQREMCGRVMEALHRNRSVMVQMPTGTGKTVVLAAVVREFAANHELREENGRSRMARVLVVAHRRELLEQIRTTVVRMGMEESMVRVESIQKLTALGREGLKQNDLKQETLEQKNLKQKGLKQNDLNQNDLKQNDLNQKVLKQKGLKQNDLKQELLEPEGLKQESIELGALEVPDLVVIDEAHHALAKSYRWLWELWPKAKFIGLTATPCRMNREGFQDLFDQLILSNSIEWFIRQGYLSDFEYLSGRIEGKEWQKIRGMEKRGADGDYQTKEMATVLDCRESIAHLYETYRAFAAGRQGIVYAINREHALHIRDYYAERGVKVVVIDAKTPTAERDMLVEAYRCGEVEVMVNVDIFSEGFDCPEVGFIQLARPTLSLAKYLQQVGRGMRVSPGKSRVVILDMVGMYQTFGLPTDLCNWTVMFKGEVAGKGVPGGCEKMIWTEDSEERTLVNLEMMRICSGRENRGVGRQLFVQQGLYGVMMDGRLTCPAMFVEMRPMGEWLVATYPETEHYRKTLISKDGQRYPVSLYGEVTLWEGEFLRGEDREGRVLYWDTLGSEYYREQPVVVKTQHEEFVRQGKLFYLRYRRLGLPACIEAKEYYENSRCAIIRNWFMSYRGRRYEAYVIICIDEKRIFMRPMDLMSRDVFVQSGTAQRPAYYCSTEARQYRALPIRPYDKLDFRGLDEQLHFRRVLIRD